MGGILACRVEAAKDASITAIDYLRAIAVTRIVLPSNVEIVAPLASIPISAPVMESQRRGFYGQEKVAGLVLFAGASDYGLVTDKEHSIEYVRELAVSAGYQTGLRDCRHHFVDEKASS